MDNQAIADYWSTIRVIAEALGMKLVKLDKPEILDWYEPTLGRQVHIEKWWYYDLLGENISGTWDTKENAFEHAEIPDYLGDIHEALKLTVDGYLLELRERNEPSRGKWFAQYTNDHFLNAATGWSDNPAGAICKAFLELQQFVSDKSTSLT